MREQPVLVGRVEDGESGGRCQRIATKGRTMLTRREQPADLGSKRHEGTDRDSPGKPLGDRDGVRDDSSLLEGKPSPRATDAGLNLVDDEQCPCRLCQRARQLQGWRVRRDVPSPDPAGHQEEGSRNGYAGSTESTRARDRNGRSEW